MEATVSSRWPWWGHELARTNNIDEVAPLNVIWTTKKYSVPPIYCFDFVCPSAAQCVMFNARRQQQQHVSHSRQRKPHLYVSSNLKSINIDTVIAWGNPISKSPRTAWVLGSVVKNYCAGRCFRIHGVARRLHHEAGRRDTKVPMLPTRLLGLQKMRSIRPRNVGVAAKTRAAKEVHLVFSEWSSLIWELKTSIPRADLEISQNCNRMKNPTA